MTIQIGEVFYTKENNKWVMQSKFAGNTLGQMIVEDQFLIQQLETILIETLVCDFQYILSVSTPR